MIFKTIYGRYGWKNIIRNIRSQGKSPIRKLIRVTVRIMKKKKTVRMFTKKKRKMKRM